MKPSEKLIKIRGELSRPQFAKKLGVEPHVIRGIEEEKQNIPKELALKLELEYGIPFKWWMTGEGPMQLEPTPEQREKAETIASALQQKLNLTDSEMKDLETALNKNKVLVLSAIKAAIDDPNAIEQLKKLIC